MTQPLTVGELCTRITVIAHRKMGVDEAARLMPHPPGSERLTIRQAMDAALVKVKQGAVETAW